MTDTDNKDNKIQVKRLAADTNYYANVFKKTEKIVSVIFYILSETKTTNKTETHLDIIRDRALKTHESSLMTLSLQGHEQLSGLEDFRFDLVALTSTLRIAQMAGVIGADVFELINSQLDAVLRYLTNHYLESTGVSVEELTETMVPTSNRSVARSASRPRSSTQGAGEPTRQRRVNIPAGDISSDAYLVYSQLTDRAERIKTVLEAKPQATVKDISEIITDVSEKTIQRELNSLIEKGQVVREGERRWSRYSVSK
jgi:DNA-binding transcriptional ArsR family regulator